MSQTSLVLALLVELMCADSEMHTDRITLKLDIHIGLRFGASALVTAKAKFD